MIGRLDRWWCCLLGTAYRWIVRRVNAHYRREARRQFWRQLAWQKAHLN